MTLCHNPEGHDMNLNRGENPSCRNLIYVALQRMNHQVTRSEYSQLKAYS